YGVEQPFSLFDAAGPLVPGNRGADMVRASALASSGDFLLRLAGCQRKNLVIEGRRAALAATGFVVVLGRPVLALERPLSYPSSAFWLRPSVAHPCRCCSAQAHAQPLPARQFVG